MKLTSNSLGNRVEAIDLIRGFALLGIFIANMLFFHTPILYIDPFSWFSAPGDAETFKWISIFVQGSFYPIFAMLFGYGINMQYEKAMKSRAPFAPFLARRLAILVAFGLVHALLIWAGDILLSYAVMGFLLILFVRVPAKWLVPIAAVLYIIPMWLIYVLIRFVEKVDPTAVDSSFVDLHQIEKSISAYAHGSFGELFMQRFTDWLSVGVLSGLLLGLFMVLPLIMIGAALSKWKVIQRAGEMKGRLVVVAVVMIAGGVWIKSIPFTKASSASNQILAEIGGPILAAGYVAVLLLLTQIPLFRIVFRPVAKAGRMSLTTYITQSIVATIIFYSYGFGLYGKVDLETGTWIAIGVFVIQIMFAELWLSKFRMGPLEWVWRKLTYGRNLSSKEEKVEDLS